MPYPQREHSGFADSAVASIERSLTSLNNHKNNVDEGSRRAHSAAEQSTATAILADLLSNLQDLCTVLCIGGDGFMRSLDCSRHVQVLIQCYQTTGVGIDIKILTLRAIALIAEGASKGVTALVNMGGIRFLLGIIQTNLNELVASDQLAEEVLKCLQSLAIDANKKMIQGNAIVLLLNLSQSLGDHIAKALAFSCLSDLISVVSPDDWEDMQDALDTLMGALHDHLAKLKQTIALKGQSQRADPKTLRSALASINHDEGIVYKLCGCFVHLIDRSCVNERMCEIIFSSACGEQLIPTAVSMMTLSGSFDWHDVHTNASKSFSKLQSAAVSIITSMFVASPRQTLRRLSQHDLWRLFEKNLIGLVSSASCNNTMKAMSHGEVGEALMDVLAALNKPRTTDIAQIPAGLGNSTTISSVTLNAANRALLASMQAPMEPLVSEEFKMVSLLELILLVTPAAGEYSVDARTRMWPAHTWQWEDDFHNRNDYEDHVSSALEIEYRAQQISRQYRSVDITAASRSVSASFEKMRHYTTGGLPLRPLFRVPFVAYFYHVRTPINCQCTCYRERVKSDEESRVSRLQPISQTRGREPEDVLPTDRSERNKKKTSKGFFSGFCGCCSAERDVSPRRKDDRERRASHKSKGTTGDILSMGAGRDDQFFDNECKIYFDGNSELSTTVAQSLVQMTVIIIQRTVNVAVLRHSAILLLRGLSLLKVSPKDKRRESLTAASSTSSTGNPISEVILSQKTVIVKALAILLTGCDLEHLERLCASTANINENADSTHMPKWQLESDERSLPFCPSLQGDILMAVLECILLLVSMHRTLAQEMHKEGLYKTLCAALKSLVTLHDAERNCPRHQPTQFLMAEMSQSISQCLKAIESITSPIRYTSGTALFALMAAGSPLTSSTSKLPNISAMAPKQGSTNSLDDALNTQLVNGVDKTCPVALAPAIAFLASLQKNNPLSLNDILASSLAVKSTTFESNCQLCTVSSELLRADMTTFYEWQAAQNPSSSCGSFRLNSARSLHNKAGQTLPEFLASSAGATFRGCLEELTIRLLSFITEQVGVAGSSIADIVSVTRNHKTVKQPNSLVLLCIQQRLSMPISFRFVPHHSAKTQSQTIDVNGKTIRCTLPASSIKTISLQAFLFTTVGALADDVIERYNETISRRRTIDSNDVCAHCAGVSNVSPRNFPQLGRLSRRLSTLHPLSLHTRNEVPLPDVTDGGNAETEPVERRLNLDEREANSASASTPPQAELLPNQVDEIGGHPPSPLPKGASPTKECKCSHTTQAVAANRVILLVNGFPLVDRSKRVADILIAFGPSSASFRSLLDTSGCDPDARQALLRTLGTWGMQHTLQFAILEEPLPPNTIPQPDKCGCTCNQPQNFDTPNDEQDTPRMKQAVIRYQECKCSPWHVYADQASRHEHNLTDDILRLIGCLVELVVAPLSPHLLLDVGRKLYSSVIHAIRFQSLSFVAPAFTFLCHPLYNTHRVGDSIAEYALWNYPSIFPLVLRIAVFRQIISAKRAIMPKSSFSSQNIVGGQWLRHLQGGDAPAGTRVVRNKVKTTVSRDNILGETKRVLESMATCPLTLDVEFQNEPGSGLGPTCEFFCLAATEFVRRDLSMWLEATTTEEITSPYIAGYLYPAYVQNPQTLEYFVLIGRLLGRALQDGREIRIPLHATFVKQILGGNSISPMAASQAPPVDETLSDKLRTIDPQLEHSLQSLEALPSETIEGLELNFTFPGLENFELAPNGQLTAVTSANVGEYCSAVRLHACVTCLEEPVRCILAGISDSIVPGHLRLFTPSEFNLLVGGPEGKVWGSAEDLLRNIQCDHGYTLQSKAVEYFISAVVSLASDEQRLLLKFISGSDCVPIGGLSPPITIVRKGLNVDATPYRRRRRHMPTMSNGATSEGVSAGDNLSTASEQAPLAAVSAISGLESSPFPLEGDSPFSTPQREMLPEESEVMLTTQEQVDECLPTVNTCFHYLKLPDYSSEQVCKERLLCAISEGQGVFLLS